MGLLPTILVVEDDDGSRYLLQFIISMVLPGARVVEAPSVAAARSALSSTAVTAVLTDYHLPDGTGLDVIGAANAVDPAVPVLANSADPDASTAMVQAGACGFFSKPFDMPQLAAQLQRFGRGAA